LFHQATSTIHRRSHRSHRSRGDERDQPVAVDNLASAAANMRAGKLQALAVTTAQGSPLLERIPAVAETFNGFAIDTWWGLVAPAGTPADVVQRLNTAIVKALNSPEVSGLYRDMMMETVTNTPEAFGDFMRKELAHYQEVVRLSAASVT